MFGELVLCVLLRASAVVQAIGDTAVRLLLMIITSCKGGGCNKVINTLEQLKKKKEVAALLTQRCGTQLCFMMSSHPGEKWDYS